MSMAEATAKKFLTSERWLLWNYDNPAASKTVIRMIPDIPNEAIDACLTYLASYTDVTNDSTASQTIANPQVDRSKTRTGTYRRVREYIDHTRCDPQDAKSRITRNLFQELHLEADLSASSGSVSDLHEETEFETLDVVRHTSQTTGVADTTHSDGTIVRTENTKDPVTGLFRTEVATRTATTNDDFASAQTITAFETRTTDTDLHDTAADTPEVAQSAGYVKTYETEEDEFGRYRNSLTTRTATQAVDTVAEKTISKFETRTLDLDRNDAAAETAETVQTAGQIKTTRSEKNEFALYDNSVETRTATNVDSAETSAEYRDDETIERALNRNETAALASPSAHTDGKIETVVNRQNEFARYDTELTTRTAINVTDAGAEKTISKFETVAVDTDRHDSAAETQETVQTAGQIKTTKADRDEFGTFTNTVTTRTAANVDNAETSAEYRDDETIERALNRNETAALASPNSHTDGKIETVVNRQNEFGRYDTELTTRTAVQQTVTHDSESRADQTGSTTITHHAAAKVDASGGGSGTIVRASSKMNEFGLFENLTETITAVPLSTSGYTSRTQLDEQEGTTWSLHDDVVGDASGGGSGTIKRARSTKNEFGKFNTETVEITAVPVADELIEKTMTAHETVDVDRDHHDPAADSHAGSFTAGTIATHSAQKNPFGLFDNKVTTRTAVAWYTGSAVGDPWVSYTDAQGTSYYCAFGNLTSAQVATIAGLMTAATNNSFSVSINEFGRYDGRGYRIAQKTSGSDFDTGVDFAITDCYKHSQFSLFKASIKYTTSRTTATNFLAASLSYGSLVDYGAGERTGITYAGRGVWRAVRVEGKNP